MEIITLAATYTPFFKGPVVLLPDSFLCIGTKCGLLLLVSAFNYF